jgi:hypothetical protein
MPIGILNISHHLSMKFFKTATLFTGLINSYFAGIGIESNIKPRLRTYQLPKVTLKNTKPPDGKTNNETHDPPTLTGLALFMGFQSLKDFEIYEGAGEFAYYLKRARLLITTAYEKRLHNTNPSGAIFALKGLGWNKEKPEDNKTVKMPTSIEIKITDSGPQTVGNEKDVNM